MDAQSVRHILSQPTRARLVTALRDAGKSMSTAELAEILGLHPNGVRTHLKRLGSAGVVQRSTEQQVRGRPREMWALSADFVDTTEPAPSDYANMARWLARALPEGDEGIAMAERTGERIGSELAPTARGETPTQKLRDVLSSLGFRPEIESETAAGVNIKLCNCPYRDTARERQDAVCALHKGVTKGLLAEFSPSMALSRWHPKDPDVAGCELGVYRADALDEDEH